jgi:hypothetical protein
VGLRFGASDARLADCKRSSIRPAWSETHGIRVRLDPEQAGIERSMV